ncbi:MAG: hypothetical protein H7Y36_09620, partial [Armatimonadetes bacterium]|nr:hypothetical protein [Akkermansiaceae bacterium]
QQLGAGDLAETPQDLTQSVCHILANNSAKWRKMKAALINHNRNDGAITAASFILSQV